MSTPRMEAQLESYKILKDLLHKFRATLDPHLDETSLSRQGVDVSKFDLQEETGNEGTYFLPAAQSHVQALRERPSIHWDFMHGRCNIGDSMEIDQTVGDQFFRSKVGPTNVWAHELTPWRGRRLVKLPTTCPTLLALMVPALASPTDMSDTFRNLSSLATPSLLARMNGTQLE